MENTFEIVRDILVDQLGINEEMVTPDTSLVEDLGMDSFDSVELPLQIEDELGVEIPEGDFEKCRTVGGLILLVDKLKQEEV